eukprot:1515448-Rhodomonas_salina.1
MGLFLALHVTRTGTNVRRSRQASVQPFDLHRAYVCFKYTAYCRHFNFLFIKYRMRFRSQGRSTSSTTTTTSTSSARDAWVGVNWLTLPPPGSLEVEAVKLVPLPGYWALPGRTLSSGSTMSRDGFSNTMVLELGSTR